MCVNGAVTSQRRHIGVTQRRQAGVTVYEKQRRVVAHHIAVQLHAAPAAAGQQGPMRVDCSGLSVELCVVFPCVLWCRRFIGDDTTFR